MPLVRTIRNKENSTIIGIWELSESLDRLFAMIDLNEQDLVAYHNFKAEGRKKQWLASRIILHQISENNKLSITYGDNRNPLIEGRSQQLSISHTNEFVTVILSDKFRVGIDIEKIHPRVLKIRHKFVSDEESEYLSEDQLNEKLILIWSAKEALYKMYGRGKLDFRKNLKIEPFNFQADDCVSGVINTGNIKRKYALNYLKISDHLMVYVADI